MKKIDIKNIGGSEEEFNKELILKLVFSAVPAVFGVVFLWNFWHKGIYALGFNVTVFLFLLLGLFVWVLYKKGRYTNRDLFWIIPLALIAFSYSIYDNPFLKMTGLLVLPVMFVIFYNQAFLTDKKNAPWDREFIFKTINRFFSFLPRLGRSVALYLNLMIPAGNAKKRVAVRAFAGIILFLIIALAVFIPLLSSADPVFADKMGFIYDWLEIISLPLVYRILTAMGSTILFFSVLTAWSKRFDHTGEKAESRNIDPVVSGIVLGGILCLYLLFLWVQINRLWVGDLPFDFKETENLVKSGFWQLILLSIINILIYFSTYKRTIAVVQKILAAFTVASLFLLISAGYRMGLYVTYYGFSYEKFFASYTVIYCSILLIWLVSRLFAKKRANILKFVLFLFLWMYAIATVSPVEQFILRTNVALKSNIEESRIRLFELTMLSPDVLSLVKEYEQQGLLKENAGYLAREKEVKSEKQFDWEPWIEQQEKTISDKVWYEKNLMNVVYVYENK
jgi:hypothetical protein